MMENEKKKFIAWLKIQNAKEKWSQKKTNLGQPHQLT